MGHHLTMEICVRNGINDRHSLRYYELLELNQLFEGFRVTPSGGIYAFESIPVNALEASMARNQVQPQRIHPSERSTLAFPWARALGSHQLLQAYSVDTHYEKWIHICSACQQEGLSVCTKWDIICSPDIHLHKGQAVPKCHQHLQTFSRSLANQTSGDQNMSIRLPPRDMGGHPWPKNTDREQQKPRIWDHYDLISFFSEIPSDVKGLKPNLLRTGIMQCPDVTCTHWSETTLRDNLINAIITPSGHKPSSCFDTTLFMRDISSLVTSQCLFVSPLAVQNFQDASHRNSFHL